jgi:predicted PurR-regulated permease PerM
MTNIEAVASREAVDLSGARLFARRVIGVCFIGAALLAVWKLSDLLVLTFGAALLALLLRGLAYQVSRITRLPESSAVLPVILTLLGSVIAVEWLFGSQITSQFSLLAKDLPESFDQLAREFASSPWGAWLLGHAQDMNLSSATGPVAGYIAAVFGSVFRTGAYVGVLFFAAMYFAMQPAR